MVDRHFQFLSSQIRANEESLTEHTAEYEPWELESRIKVGVAILQAISDFDEHLGRETITGRMPNDRETTDRLRALYADWERANSALVPRLKALEAKGGRLASGEAFKDAILTARSTLSISIDDLDESARQLREGTKRSMAEVMDGIRRRLGA